MRFGLCRLWYSCVLVVYKADATDHQQTENLYLWQLFGEDASNLGSCGDSCIRFHLEDKHPEIRGTVTTALLYIYDHSSELNRSANQEHPLEVHGVNIHGRPHHLVASRNLTVAENMERWKTLDILQPYLSWKRSGRNEITVKVHFRGDLSNSRFHVDESHLSFLLIGVSHVQAESTVSLTEILNARRRRSAHHENNRSGGHTKCQQNAIDQECCIQDVHVSLQQLGTEFSWILRPRDLTIGHCIGRCLSTRLTTLAVLLGRRSNYGTVCCHPSIYEPITIFFNDGKTGLLLDASAKSCSCS